MSHETFAAIAQDMPKLLLEASSNGSPFAEEINAAARRNDRAEIVRLVGQFIDEYMDCVEDALSS